MNVREPKVHEYRFMNILKHLISMIVIKTYFGAVVFETMRRFDLLRQILVTHVFGLTQILAEGSGCRWGVAGIPDHDSLWGRVA